MVYNWINKALSWIYPYTCILCSAPGYKDTDLCQGCWEDLPLTKNTCPQCAKPMADDIEVICGQCQQHPPYIQTTHASLLYRHPTDYMIHQLKFSRRLAMARVLGNIMVQQLQDRDHLPQQLIPVPLYASRLRQRGFNQSYEIAKIISKQLSIPVNNKLCVRHKNTQAQSLLKRHQRHDNMRDAFKIKHTKIPSHVAIIDDVMTSGHTLNELARILHDAGVQKIEAWVCTRAS